MNCVFYGWRLESDNLSIIQYRFCLLAFGLRPSPSILGVTIKKHLEGYIAHFPNTIKVLGCLFVDDLSCSTESNELHRYSEHV